MKEKNLTYKKTYFSSLFLFFILCMISCSGEERMSNNELYPAKPFLIPHLGTIGDNDWLTDTNNGIDSLSDGDWIRLQWDKLIDNDLRIIRIYRFAGEINQFPVIVDSVIWNNTQYIDRLTSASIGDISRLDTDWHYFIRVVNFSNNYTDSDTVNFRLSHKPLLEYPIDGALFEGSSDINFKWRNQGDTTRLRLLLFMENSETPLWYFDEFIFINDLIYEKKYDGEPLLSGSYIWRVDSRGIADSSGHYHSGSKSNIRRFIIQ